LFFTALEIVFYSAKERSTVTTGIQRASKQWSSAVAYPILIVVFIFSLIILQTCCCIHIWHWR